VKELQATEHGLDFFVAIRIPPHVVRAASFVDADMFNVNQVRIGSASGQIRSFSHRPRAAVERHEKTDCHL